MTIYTTSLSDNVRSGANRAVFTGFATVPVALVAADKVRVVRIPAGTKVDRVVMSVNGDLDSGTVALTGTLGFEHADGSTGADIDRVAAVGHAATIAFFRVADTLLTNIVYELFPPEVLEKDAFLTYTCAVAPGAQAASAEMHGKVEGEALGVK